MGAETDSFDGAKIFMMGKHQIKNLCSKMREESLKTRPDTRLPQSRAGGQGPYLRSLHHFGRSREAKYCKTPKKSKCDGRTDGRKDGPTDEPTDRQSGV